MKPAIFWLAARFVLGALFIFSGFEKIIQPYQNFQFVIESYEVVEGFWAAWAARMLPWAEAVLGGALLLGFCLKRTIPGLMCLNVVFLSVLAQAMLRRLPIEECGCFGQAFQLPLPVVFLVDAMILITLGFMHRNRRMVSACSLDGWIGAGGAKQRRQFE